MMKYLIPITVLIVVCSVGCARLANDSADVPTAYPTPSGPALSVEEYAKACYSSFEDLQNDRGRYPTREQMQDFVMDLRDLVPPRSLEKFHYAHLRAWEVFAYEETFFTSAWLEADAQIGQLDEETYTAFRERNFCGLDENLFSG